MTINVKLEKSDIIVSPLKIVLEQNRTAAAAAS
jgi:hypothetical protein